MTPTETPTMHLAAIPPARSHPVTDFGAVSDGTTDNANAIQAAIDACAATGGGRVVIPAGVFMSGKIFLRSRIELHLEMGAVLLCSPDNAALRDEKLGPGLRNAFLCAKDAEDIAVTGLGVIDGNGRAYIKETLPHIHVMHERRPVTLYFGGCRRVTMTGVTVRDAAAWTLWFCGCDDLLVHGIRIDNDLRLPNNDGIDLDRCRNVRISDCHIDTGDDAIVIKAMREFEHYGACENIVVTGCTLKSTSSALCIGCEIAAPVRRVIFDSCTISSSHRGLSINHSFESDIEDVLFSNITIETRLFNDLWWGRGEPIYVKALPWTETDRVGRIRNVRFRDIRARSENGILVWGESPDRIDGIEFENVDLTLTKWSKHPGGKLDLRPCPGGDNGYASGVIPHPTLPLIVRNARDVSFRGCRVRVAPGVAPKEAGVLRIENVEGFRFEGLTLDSVPA